MDTADLLREYIATSKEKGAKHPQTWAAMMKYRARSLANDCDLTSDEGRDDLIEAAIAYDLSFTDKRVELFIARHFWPEIRRLTGVEMDYILDLTEALKERQKKERHDQAIREGLQEAAEHADRGEILTAKAKFVESIQRAENALLDVIERPILNVSDALGGLMQSLKKTQGIRYLGLSQSTIPELNDALDGIQGLNLITAKSGEGKTMLALQIGLDVLTEHENVSLLIVSLDMTEERILKRLLTNRAKLPINVVTKGSTPEGWSADEKIRIDAAFLALKSVGSRIRILDRFNFPTVTRSTIMREMTRLQNDSNTETCMVIMDFLQLFMVPQGYKDDKDEWRMEELRAIQDTTGAPMLLIATSRKTDTGDSPGSADNVKGSHGIVMRSDNVITLRPYEKPEQLLNDFEVSDDGYVSRRGKPYDPGKASRDERDAAANKIRTALAKSGRSAIWLKVDKGRDGAEKTEFSLINHFKKNIISPSLGT